MRIDAADFQRANEVEARQADEDERTLERIEAQMHERYQHERYQEGLDDYDANADFAGSLDDCYAAIRARVASGRQAVDSEMSDDERRHQS